jgi:hypothetical protein
MSSAALSTAPCKLHDIYVEAGSNSFDLHNEFDFVGFTYDTAGRIVSLRWVSGEGTPADERRALVVEMRGVWHVSSTPRDPEMPFTEDSCLHCVGRIPPSAPTLDSIAEDAPADWHYVFSFMSGFMLRIGAESVCLQIHVI